jgi:hypothetical protein
MFYLLKHFDVFNGPPFLYMIFRVIVLLSMLLRILSHQTIILFGLHLNWAILLRNLGY